MFIKDGVYREIDVKVDAPIAEGTILTFGGTLAAEDASDAFGIVPENIYVLPPTKKTRVVIGGTIDLDDPANKGVEFSEAVVNALGADINFVPAAEAGGGGAELPAATSADEGKVLTVKKTGYKKGTVIIPEQTLTTQGQYPQARISNYDTDLWVIGQKVVVCINDMEYESALNDANGIADFYSGDGYAIIREENLNFSSLESGTYTVSAYIAEDTYGYVPGSGGGGALIVNSSYDSTANNHVLDKTAQEIYDALLSGTSVYIKYQYGSLSTYVGHLILAPVVRLYNYDFTNVIRILAVRPNLGAVNSHAESGIPGVWVYSAGGVDEYPIYDVERSTQVSNPYMINAGIS